jgi:DNA-binding protein
MIIAARGRNCGRANDVIEEVKADGKSLDTVGKNRVSTIAD